jgi:hypothetical protein
MKLLTLEEINKHQEMLNRIYAGDVLKHFRESVEPLFNTARAYWEKEDVHVICPQCGLSQRVSLIPRETP